MKTKTFKSLEEQINQLLDKNLIIDDYDYTRNILLRENYFFISGYRHLFMTANDSSFIKGTTFNELYAMFSFDRQIRNVIFKNILVFENNLKSILSYVVSKNHGFKENNYLNPKIFVRTPQKHRQVNDLIRKMKRQINVNGKQHSATSHFMDRYGFIPLWVVVKVLSFGIIGELYQVLQIQDQQEISDIFNVNVDKMVLYLPILANYRNLCAHEDVCFQHRNQKDIDDTEYHHKLYIPKGEYGYLYGKNDLFALVIILKQVLNEKDFIMFMNEINYEIDVLDGRVETIELNKILNSMGFPPNYKEMVRI